MNLGNELINPFNPQLSEIQCDKSDFARIFLSGNTKTQAQK